MFMRVSGSVAEVISFETGEDRTEKLKLGFEEVGELASINNFQTLELLGNSELLNIIGNGLEHVIKLRSII